ncbi:MAG: T9SS type A sorting domain-containing protein [Ignavibacteria bacterium]
MKINLLIFSFIFLFAVPLLSQSYVQTCIGTDTISSNYPFLTYWMDGRTQMLFTKHELLNAGGIPGSIIGIKVYVKSVDTLTMNNFAVKMLNTLDSTLTNFVSAGWQTVYLANHKVQDTGWHVIMFATPFTWNGNNNILLEICYNNSQYTWYSRVSATPSSSKMVGAYADLPNGDGCIDLVGGYIQPYRVNICFLITPYSKIVNNSHTPTTFCLYQNYPNPFNTSTQIKFDLPQKDYVKLSVYNAQGREISCLAEGEYEQGSYLVGFDGSTLASGFYFYVLRGSYSSITKKMILLK